MADRPFIAVPDSFSDADPAAGQAAAVPTRRGTPMRWVKLILLIFAVLWLASAAVSVLIQHTRLRAKLTTRLADAFGRPVEVGSYNFTLWTGPTLVAQPITIEEDPRFGKEYFLRAESLRVQLRWQSLLRGRFELGTLSLTQPSLNLVQNEQGDWNLAEWLPRPAASSGPGTPHSAPPSAHLRRIEVEAGRIDFKRGNEKLPFAFVGLEGTVELEDPDRWRIDLKAIPWRAAVIVQQAGTIHAAGNIGGTSSRLLPAALDVSWTDASISDVLRLARAYDYGIRGTLALSVKAHTEGSSWVLQTRTELQQLHRWDLTLRSDNPSVNLVAQMKLDPRGPGLELTEATLETPHSHARVSGRLAWNNSTPYKKKDDLSPLYVQLSSSQIDLNDALAWVRAFYPGIADDASVRGSAAARGVVSGWPLQLETALFTTDGADLTGAGIRVPIHWGKIDFSYDRSRSSLLPMAASFGSADTSSNGLFRAEASFKPGSIAPSGMHLAGNLIQARDLIAVANLLGWNVSRGWDLAGPIRFDLRWQGSPFFWQAKPVGSIDLGAPNDPLGGGSLQAPFLNHPVEQIRARADLKPGSRHIALSSSSAFGGRWSGTFDQRDSDGGWQFALAADRLSGADLDRWLNPRWRESFFYRVFPFLNSAVSANVLPENLRSSGHVSIDQFTLAPLVVEHLNGNAKIEGRHLELAYAGGQLYGGDVKGSLEAELTAVPQYNISADFSDVDLAAFAAASPYFSHLFAGSASGYVSFSAHGATRADLLSSLECHGSSHVRDPQLHNINLAESLQGAVLRPGVSSFQDASAAFICGGGKVEFHDLSLLGPDGEIDGSGSFDFSRNLDFRLWVPPGSTAPPIEDGSDPSRVYRLTGSLTSPEITQAEPPARRRR